MDRLLVKKAYQNLNKMMMGTEKSDPTTIYQYVSLCNVLARELGLEGYELTGILETPRKLGGTEVSRAEMLIAVASMYLDD